MADNILTTDRAAAPIDIAAKDIAGVLVPRNILTTPAGADLSPLTDAELRNSPVPVSVPSLPLPPDAATQTTLAALLAALGPPTAVTIVSLTTNATGATFVAFGSQACEQLDLVNTAPAAVDLEVRRGGTGNTITVPAGSSRMFVGLANASDLQARRLDQSNVQVTFTAEAIKQ